MTRANTALILLIAIACGVIGCAGVGREPHPIFGAVATGDLERVELLASESGVVNLRDANGQTPLHKAVIFNHPEIAEALLRNGAAVDAQCDGGETPLYLACLLSRDKGRDEIVRLLLRSGADPNIRAESGFSPLLAAAFSGQMGTVEALLSSGAKTCPFSHAALGHIGPIQNLLRGGLGLDDLGPHGWTVLNCAAYAGRNRMVAFLLENGASPNIGNREGFAPLHHAAYAGDEKMAELLIDHGADVNVRAKFGRTPLHQATAARQKPMVEFLLGAGADPNVRNEDCDETPLDYTYHTNDESLREIGQLLLQANAKRGHELGAANKTN